MSSNVLKGAKVWMSTPANAAPCGWAQVEQARANAVRFRIGEAAYAEATVEQARAFAAHIMDIAKRAEGAGKG